MGSATLAVGADLRVLPVGQHSTLRLSRHVRLPVPLCRSTPKGNGSSLLACGPGVRLERRLELVTNWKERTCLKRGSLLPPSSGSATSSMAGRQVGGLLAGLPRGKVRRRGCVVAAQANIVQGANIVKPAIAVAGTVLVRIPPPILIPSCIAVIIYALMGLEGFVRWTRNRCKKLLNQPEEVPGEDNWSSSRVRKYVLPYIKPVVIWAAVFVLCGALDRLPTPHLLNKVKLKAVNVVRVFASVFSVTYCITVLIQHMQAVVYKPVGANEQVGKELVMQTIEAAIWFLGFALGMELLGVASNSFITAGGIGTLVFTFAGKEIVGNALSGMTIQATKPFTVGDWISIMVNGQFVEGHVENMGWWQLTLKTFERESSRIANQQVINSVITNVTAKTHWRFKSYIHLYLFTPEEQVQKIVMDIRKLLAEHPKIEHRTLHRRVFYDGHNISVPSKDVLVSCYFQTRWQEEYAKLKEELMYEIERIISRHGSRYATPIRTHDYTAGSTPPSMSSSPYDSPTQRLFLAEMTVYKNPSQDASKLGVVDVTASAATTVDVTPTAVVDVEAENLVVTAAKEQAEVSTEVAQNGADVSKDGADVSKDGAELSKGGSAPEVGQNGAVQDGVGASDERPVRKVGDVSKSDVAVNGVADIGKDAASRRDQLEVAAEKEKPKTGSPRGSDPEKGSRVSDKAQNGALERELADILRRTGSPGRPRASGVNETTPAGSVRFSDAEARVRGVPNQPWVTGSTPSSLHYSTPEEAAAAAAAFSAQAAEAAAAARELLSRLQGGEAAGDFDPPVESTSYPGTRPSERGHARRPKVTPLDVEPGLGGKRSQRMEPLGPRTSDRPKASSSPKGVTEPNREVETMSDVPYRGIKEASSPGREWAKQYFAGDRQAARGFTAVSEFEHLQDSDEEDLRVSEADAVDDLRPMSEEEAAGWRQADSGAATTSGSNGALHEGARVDGGDSVRKGPVGGRGDGLAAQPQSRTDPGTGPLKEKLEGLETMGLSRSDITLLGIAIDKTGRQSAVLDSAFDPSVSPTQLAQRGTGGAKGQGGSPPESGSGKQGGVPHEDVAQENGEKEAAPVLIGKEGGLPAGANAIPPVTEQMG